jgi:hypothetical protein
MHERSGIDMEGTPQVQEIVKLFYCDICNKQYTNDGQFQEHLDVSLLVCIYMHACAGDAKQHRWVHTHR